MSQAWNVPILAGDKVSAALQSKVNDALEALRTLHAGASDPTATVAYMIFTDTASLEIKQRDAGDTAFSAILAPNSKNHQDEPQIFVAGVAGSGNYPIYAPGQAWKALELVILSDVTTAGSGAGTDWTFQIGNLTAATTLFATPPATDGTGGAPGEILAGTPWVVACNQNQDLTANDFLELQIAQNGAPTSLAAARLIFAIRGTLIGA